MVSRLSNEQQKNEEEEVKKDEILESPLFIPMPALETQLRATALYGEIDEERSKDCIGSLMHLFESGKEYLENDENPDEVIESYSPMELLISTEGGHVHEMFSIYDVLRQIRSKCTVQTTGLGKVMSAGVLLLAAGTKGERKVGKHCRLMLHPISGGNFGDIREMERNIKEIRWLEKVYSEALFEETNMSKKKITSILKKDRDTFFDAQQAVEWGIADHVI